ncbi:Cyclin-like protein [Coniochaeta hoffmannii]|uniref:Cyclin-like protein n=1 Tax=Coniochaeta hoffmannii TaxID=91930 RepID=A0AA38VZS3_9PEZI|nr:Cyclin-like protein [Coniochaeta hoffmannii]
MDAKPQRLPRVMPITTNFGDENAVAGKQPTHQRNKSAGNVKHGTVAGGMNAAAKRTAFGDVSNIAHGVVDFGPKDLQKPRIAILAPREKQPADEEKDKSRQGGEAFLRPPQRSFAPAVTNIPAYPPTQVENIRVEPPLKPAAAKKATFIFSDEGKNNGKPKSEAPPKTDDSASVMDNQVKNPRHFRSQPQLRTEQQPVLGRTQSRHLGSQQGGALINHVDDDVTEAPYHDAVESLSSLSTHVQDHLQVEPAAYAVPETQWDQQSSSHAEAQLAVASEASPYHADQDAATEPDDNWEEDDGDMYDDQGYTTAHSFKSHGDNTTGGVTIMLAPKVTAKVQKELDIARAIVESTTTEEQIEEEEWDPTMVAEYGEEIFTYMRKMEAEPNLAPNPHYMDIQSDITWSMRAVLMDWLVQVHNRFNLLPETLFLTVNCIDRFLSVKVVSLSKLQLVGATAIFVAAKYEEINCPSVQEIMYMVDGGFTVEEILKAERFMLSMLDFELGWPGPMSFLRRISKADDYDIDTRTLAKYFMEVTIMDERFVGSPPSYIAAGAHCLARMMLRKGHWTAAHTHYSGYTLLQLKPLVSLIIECCNDQVMHHWAVYDKYQSSRYKHVSAFVRSEISKGFRLSFEPNLHCNPDRQLLDEFTASMQYVISGDRLIPMP